MKMPTIMPTIMVANHIKSLGMALAVLVIAAGSAYAVTDASDCRKQISSAEALLLSAKITNEQLNSIATDLDNVKKMCSDGKFPEATALLKTNVDILKAASQN